MGPHTGGRGRSGTRLARVLASAGDGTWGEPSAPLDLRKMRLATRKVLSGEVDVRRHDLQGIAELMGDLRSDLTEGCEPLLPLFWCC